MLRYEWRKVLGSRFVVLSVLVLLLINAIVCYFQTRPNARELPNDAFEAFFERYMSNEAEMEQEYREMQTFLSEQRRIWGEQMALGNREFEMQEWNNQYAPEGYTDAQFFQAVLSLKEYSQNFPSTIERAIRTAYAQILNSSTDGIDTDSYLYRYQAEVIRRYQNVRQNVTLTPVYVKGWGEYFSYDFMSVFLLLSVVVISGFVFTQEHQTGAAQLIFTTKNGRLRTTVYKAAVVYGSALILCLLFCSETLFMINLTTGFSGMDAPIQTLSGFLYCPYLVTIQEYLMMDFGLKLLAALVFTAISAAVSAGFRSYPLTYISCLGLLGLHYVFFITKIPSGENFLRAVNLMSAATSQTILDRYRAVRFGNTPMFYPHVLLFTFAVTAVLLTVFLLFQGSRSGAVRHVGRMKRKRRACPVVKKKEKSLAFQREFSMSLFCAEVYKSLLSSRLIFGIAALLLVKGFMVSSDLPSKKSFADEMYHEYMSELSGPMDEEKRTYVWEERNNISETLNRYDAATESYRNDEMTLEEYRDYLSKYNYAYSHTEILTQIENHVSYIDKMAENGKEAWFVYDTGWQKLWQGGFDWSLYALILLLCSNLFASEYNSRTSSAGFHQILRTTKHGREKTFRMKAKTAAILSLIFSLLWSAIDWFAVLRVYELPAYHAPIWSIEAFSEMEYTITIGQFAVLSHCVRILAYVVLAMLTTALSLLLRKSVSAILSVTVLTLLPRILSTLGMSVLKWMDYVDFIEATPVLLSNSENVAFTIAVVISSIGMMWLAKRAWSG